MKIPCKIAGWKQQTVILTVEFRKMTSSMLCIIFHSEQLVHLSHLGSFKPLLSCSSVTHKFIVRFVTKSKTDLPSCNLKLLLISGPCFLSSSPYPKDYFRSRNSMHQSICFLSLERDLVLFLLCHLTFV